MKPLTQTFTLPEPLFSFAGFSFPRVVAVLPSKNYRKEIQRRTNPSTGPYYIAPRPLKSGDNGTFFYLASDFMPSLRYEYADEIASIGHSGWFSDELGGGDVIRGIVFRLPRQRGFLAGWTMGEGMASEVEYYVYSDEHDAALAADSIAEHIAEINRESEQDYFDDEEADD